MKFQNPSIHHSKVNTHTDRQTDRHTDRQAESNMPFQLFQSWGHKNAVVTFQINTRANLDPVFLAHGFKWMNLKKLAGKFPNDDRLITSMAITMAVRKTHLSKSHKRI